MSGVLAEKMSSDGASLVPAIALAGLAAAGVDAVYFSSAALLAGQSPLQVLQGIAGFWLGKAAMTAGPASVVLGAATHIGLATIMAAGFAVLRKVLPLLRGPIVLAGIVYGALLYAVMYGIVLPLRWPQVFPAFNGGKTALDILVHFAVGTTIAAVLRNVGNRRVQ